MAVTMARAVAAVALVLCPLSGAQTTSGVVYTSEYEFAGGSDNSDSNGNCNPSTSQVGHVGPTALEQLVNRSANMTRLTNACHGS